MSIAPGLQMNRTAKPVASSSLIATNIVRNDQLGRVFAYPHHQ